MSFIICQKCNNTLGKLASFSSLYQAEANFDSLVKQKSRFAIGHEQILLVETHDNISQYDFFSDTQALRVFKVKAKPIEINQSQVRQKLIKIIDILKPKEQVKIDTYC